MKLRPRDWLELDDGPARLRPLEGLRGVAVLLVFCQHYAMQAILHIRLDPVGAALADLMRNFGSLGVELFFILSGFLIYGTLLRRNPGFLPFMARRMQRLYPVFLSVFVPVAIAHAVFATGAIPRDAAGAAWVLVANLLFLPGVVAMEPVMAVAWTLSWEMAFYLVLGVLVPGLRLSAWPRWGRITLILAGMAAVTWASELPEGMLDPFASPLVVLPFLFGMLLFEAEDARAWSVPAGLALLSGATALAVGHSIASSPLEREWMETVALALLCSAAFRGGNAAAGAMSADMLRWLGNISYSFYLVHGLVIVAGFRGAAALVGADWPPAMFWLLPLPALAAGAAASVVLFLAVERPYSLHSPRRRVHAAVVTGRAATRG